MCGQHGRVKVDVQRLVGIYVLLFIRVRVEGP